MPAAAVVYVHADHGCFLQSKYAVLTKADMLRRQHEAIEAVTSILGISDDDAARVLRKYKWYAACSQPLGSLHSWKQFHDQ